MTDVLEAPQKPRKGLVKKTFLKSKGMTPKPLKKAPRAKIKPKKKAWKFVKTHLQECDDAFSREIVARDGHCVFPGCERTENLTNSHYIGRANWNTRFDEWNCVALCIRHHFMDRDTAWEFQKAREEKHGWDGQYTLFMKNWLGFDGWNELLERANGDKKRKDVILETQKKYNLRQPVENPVDTPNPQ